LIVLKVISFIVLVMAATNTFLKNILDLCNPAGRFIVKKQKHRKSPFDMNILLVFVKVLMLLGAILCIGVLFFGYLKYLKKTRYPNWKFPDYISVGYAEYLYNKFIKKNVKKITEERSETNTKKA